jgi:type II secretory pathway pseudopilin PulG
MTRVGFTLLEVLLALALVVVVLGLLGIAIDVHLRVADASLNEVEETQSARLVLRRMADDLRKAIPVTRAPSSIGGLQGNRRELQFDMSRMPLLDEMQKAATPPSDVRTVTYFVAKPDDVESAESGDSNRRRGGLLRREWERAAFAWAIQQGQSNELDRALRVIAPDVEMIEFTYIDGGTAYTEWDSTEKGKLPSVVKIAIGMRRSSRKPRGASASGTIAETPSASYEMLVDLPNSRAALAQTLAALPAQSTASSEVKSADSSNQGTNSQTTGVKEIKPIGSGGSGQ